VAALAAFTFYPLTIVQNRKAAPANRGLPALLFL
jgi:hypothetical protein